MEEILPQDNIDNVTDSLGSKEDNYRTMVNTILDNYFGCDILLCLFVSALESYRADKCLRPFPRMYINNNNKDIDELRLLCKSIPPLSKILKNPNLCSQELQKLLLWLFNSRKGHLQLRRCSFNSIQLPYKIKQSFIPHFTYELNYSDKFEAAWRRRKGDQSSFLVYHGSQLDNFYSILAVGLQQHFGVTKEHLYGNGIYLTTEISLSMTYAPFAQTWSQNTMGDKLSIIAVCEVINDYDKVKCIDSRCKSRSKNEGSISGDIPEKYIVVTDSDMVRVKYLFVYKSKKLITIKSWLYNNFVMILICAYVLSLLCIGFFQQPSWIRFKKRLYNMLNFK